MQYEWDKIEGLTRNKLQVKKGDYTIEEESLEKNSEDGDVKDIRNELFGNSCELCGVTGIDKMLKIHRKDGKSHSNRLLWSKKYLQRLNPDDWAIGIVNTETPQIWFYFVNLSRIVLFIFVHLCI